MRSVCFLVGLIGAFMAATAALAAAAEPEILIAPDQPVPCVYVDDPLILSLKVTEPVTARVNLKLVDAADRKWDLDLGNLSLPPGVERWYALKGAPAERGFYAVSVSIAIDSAVFNRTVGICRVDRPARLVRSPLGLTVTATPWAPGLEYAIKTVGVRTLRVAVPVGDIQNGAPRLSRVGLKAALVLRTADAAALVAQPGKLQVGEEWTGIQLPASAPELFGKFRDRTSLPLWAVAGSLDECRAFLAGPGAEHAAAVVLEMPRLPEPAERAALALSNLPISIALTDPAWVQSRPPVRLMVDLLVAFAGGITSVYLPCEAVYDSNGGYAPPAALFNAFGTVFGQTEYVGQFTVAEGLDSMLFRDGPDWMLVTWRRGEQGDPVPFSLPLEGAVSVMVTDPFGNPVEEGVTNADGNLAASVGPVPVLIRGSGGNIIARAAATRAMEIASDLLALPPPAGELVTEGFRTLLETVRKNPAADGARARFLDLLRQWSQLEIAIAQGLVPPDAGIPVSRRLVMLSRVLAAVEEGRGELFVEPLSEMIADTERLQTMYMTGTPPGSSGVRLRAEQVLADLRNLVSTAETLAESGRKIEAAALAAAAQHYGKCLEVYARGSAVASVLATAAKPETPKGTDTRQPAPTAETRTVDAAKQPADQPEKAGADQKADRKQKPAPEVHPSPEAEIVHIVAKGDNPFSIAKKYGVSLDNLLKWNNLTRKSRINVGDKLIIKPRGTAGETPAVQDAAATSTPAAPEEPETRSGEADARQPAVAGDASPADTEKQPAEIPQKTGTDQKTDEKKEPTSDVQPSPEGEIVHIVAKGDNPSSIAKKYGVSLDDLLKWNNLTRKSRLNIGDKIIINKAKP